MLWCIYISILKITGERRVTTKNTKAIGLNIKKNTDKSNKFISFNTNATSQVLTHECAKAIRRGMQHCLCNIKIAVLEIWIHKHSILKPPIKLLG